MRVCQIMCISACVFVCACVYVLAVCVICVRCVNLYGVCVGVSLPPPNPLSLSVRRMCVRCVYVGCAPLRPWTQETPSAPGITCVLVCVCACTCVGGCVFVGALIITCVCAYLVVFV